MIINQIIHKEMRTYPTNLTKNQWKVIKNILNDNRKRKQDLREIFNAILWLLLEIVWNYPRRGII